MSKFMIKVIEKKEQYGKAKVRVSTNLTSTCKGRPYKTEHLFPQKVSDFVILKGSNKVLTFNTKKETSSL